MSRTHVADLKIELSPYNAKVTVVDAQAGVVATTPPRRKVAIVAAGPSRVYAPYRDDEWEMWALNAVAPRDHTGLLRVDRWFEMHEMHAQSELDLSWIERCPVPMYLVPAAAVKAIADSLYVVAVDARENMRARHVHVPHPVRYPLEAVEKAFGGYWACTFAYQLALILLENKHRSEGFRITDVGLYGVDLANGTMRERTLEYACVSWWLGYMEASGIAIHLPPHCRLGRHPYRYGIEYSDEKNDTEVYVKRLREMDEVVAARMADNKGTEEENYFDDGSTFKKGE